VKPIRRLLGDATIIGCLLLCIAAPVMWIRSHRVSDRLSWERNFHAADGSIFRMYTSLVSERGCILIQTSRISQQLFPRLLNKDEGWHYYHVPIDAYLFIHSISASRFGFGYERKVYPDQSLRTVAIPYWFATIIFAISPGLRITGFLRRRRHLSSHRCPTCGYDLRATPARCPECGTLSSLPAAAASQ